MPNRGQPVPRCPEFNNTYQKGCRCDFCRTVNTRRRTQQRLRVQARERGVRTWSDRVDPSRAREVLVKLIDKDGMSYAELERLTGLQRASLKKLYAGKSRTINRDTRRRILKLADEKDLRAFVRTTPVPLDWTRQMVYSLIAQGFTLQHQARIIRENLGVSTGFLSTVRTGKYNTVYYGSEQTMRWLVSQIGSATGPSKRSMTWAASRGHFPTRHYDSQGKLIVSSLPREARRRIESV